MIAVFSFFQLILLTESQKTPQQLRAWCVFLLFVGTSDVEQTDLELPRLKLSSVSVWQTYGQTGGL